MSLCRLFLFLFVACCGTILMAEEKIRLGIIGTTTSHVPAFVKLFHAADAGAPFDQIRVVAAYPGGMPDNPNSWNRVEQYAQDLEKQGIKLYPTIEAMLPEVDGILLESVDGRPHLEQAKPVIVAGKPLFIDKPMAASLADVLEIYRLAKENRVPVFSASSLRFSVGFQKMRTEKPLGNIIGCTTWSPCSLNDKHPDLFWYGIHGVETLFTLMGTGCQTVSRTQTNGTELVVGTWNDGRIGTFRGIRTGSQGYGAVVFGEKGIGEAGSYDGYKPLAEAICNFFLTGQVPFDADETIEIAAFMEAADVSKAKGGMPVSIADVIKKAEAESAIQVSLQIAANGALKMNNKVIELAKLAEMLDVLAVESNDRVKVVLRSEKGTPHKMVLSICNNLGQAVLANYEYER